MRKALLGGDVSNKGQESTVPLMVERFRELSDATRNGLLLRVYNCWRKENGLGEIDSDDEEETRGRDTTPICDHSD